jgi:hypothetical protein
MKRFNAFIQGHRGPQARQTLLAPHLTLSWPFRQKAKLIIVHELSLNQSHVIRLPLSEEHHEASQSLS